MKKFFAILLCLTMMTAMLAGCTHKEPEAEATATPVPTEASTQAPTPEPTAQADLVTPVPSEEPVLYTEPTQVEGYSVTTGRPSDLPYKPVAVMIENSAGSYPQHGLSRADIVYEMHVEGQISRFLCIFNDTIPEKVGPIRSCRIYFVDIIKEYDALLTHFGGPRKADTGDANVYNKFAAVGIKQRVDGMTEDTLIYRDSSLHQAPHNAYGKLPQIQERYTYDPEPHLFAFDYFDAHEYADAPEVTRADFRYSDSNRLAWQWIPESGHYLRWRNEKKAYDVGSDKKITVTNVIFQYAQEYNFPGDKKGRINIVLTGEGKFDAMIGGKLVSGTWHKDSAADTTRYITEDGQHLILEPGKTFVQVLPLTAKVDFTYAQP